LDSRHDRSEAGEETRASVIIPVWNGRRYLVQCLDALLAQVSPGAEVVAVDNGSTDGSGDLIEVRYPSVRLIRNRDNLGFAGACNAGLRAAKGEVLILLNQDTRVCEGWLDALVRACQRPEVGVVGCKAYYPGGSTIQHAGGRIEWPLGMGHHDGVGAPDEDAWNHARQVGYVTGAAMAFRRQVLDEVGLLDEGFWPGYYEDADFCFRVHEAGYEVWYVPEACLIHDESAALSGTRNLQVAFNRGRIRFVLKHLPPERFLAEFVPAERQLLVGAGQGEQGQNLRRVYVEAIPMAAVLLARRWRAGPGLVNQVLSALIGLYQGAALGPVPVEPDLDEFEFQSSVPVVGPLLARLRALWYSVAARWAVRHLTQQQQALNRHYQRRIEEQAALNEHTVRSLAVLAQEVSRLIQQLESQRGDDE
jgi:GT2 family glycosyltransferase